MKQFNINQTHNPKSSSKAFINWLTLNTNKNFFELSNSATMKHRCVTPLYGWEFYSANGVDGQEPSATSNELLGIIINCIHQNNCHATAQYHQMYSSIAVGFSQRIEA